MYIAQVEGDRLQGKFYLPGHQVQVVNVGRQSEVRITAALVGGQNQFTTVQLELHQTQAGRLVAFRTGLTQEKHVVLAVAFLPVDFRYQRRQLLEICRVTVHQDGTAVIPPVDAGLPVLLHVTFPLHEQLELAAEFLAGDIMPLEYVKQVRRCQRQLLVQKVLYVSLLVGLCFSRDKNLVQDTVILVHSHFLLLKLKHPKDKGKRHSLRHKTPRSHCKRLAVTLETFYQGINLALAHRIFLGQYGHGIRDLLTLVQQTGIVRVQVDVSGILQTDAGRLEPFQQLPVKV
nr:MAG TPA: hypothetical protein [Caudoviricetes sp.]